MPAKSQAQRAYLNARFGHAWVKEHGYDNSGKLPARAGKGKAMNKKKAAVKAKAKKAAPKAKKKAPMRRGGY